MNLSPAQPANISPPASLGRGPFLIIVVILSIVAGQFMDTKGSNDAALIRFFVALFGAMIALVILSAFRLKNIGWSATACLIGLIPILNLFLAVALASLPTNYATTKKLDPAGRIIGPSLIIIIVGISMVPSLFS